MDGKKKLRCSEKKPEQKKMKQSEDQKEENCATGKNMLLQTNKQKPGAQHKFTCKFNSQKFKNAILVLIQFFFLLLLSFDAHFDFRTTQTENWPHVSDMKNFRLFSHVD